MTPANASSGSAQLRRSLSLLDVMALGINGVVGQGIFLLPGLAAAILGPASLLALVLAAILSLCIALCFAEVGGRFNATGGAYLYARETFGPFAGFQVGWMLSWVGIISWAALANGFVVVLSTFAPAAATGWRQPVIAIGLMVTLALINLRSAKAGAAVSTTLSAVKLVPIVVFVVAGALHFNSALYEPFAPKGYGGLAEATVLLLYAFVGFESSVVPGGEMKNPQRTVPLALGSVMTVVCIVYLAVFVVTVGTLPEVAGHKNPVAAAAAGFLGDAGGTLVAAGIVISVFGINAGAALVSPRKVYALAERGDLPAFVARLDPATGVPRVAIAVTLAVAAALSLTGTFKDLAMLGVVARFVQYIPTCLATLVLRRRRPASAGFRVPLGPTIPLLAIGLCLWLIVNTPPMKLLAGLGFMVLGVPLYLWRRRLAPS